MLHTPLCDLLAIDLPIIQAGMGPWASADLAAAVSNAGGLGTVGAGTRPSPEHLRRELTRVRELTDRPFAVNHTVSNITEDAFAITLATRPALVSFALSSPGDLVERAHEAGSLVMCQVTTVDQARQAASQGADVIIAQGAEAGGFGGRIAALPLVPQVVDAVRPVPVVAAGGIADGRGIAAALCLGAQAVNMGTRFLASEEAPIHRGWQQAILAAESQDPIKFEVLNEFFGSLSGEYETVPRTLRSPFVERWREHGDEARAHAEQLRAAVTAAVTAGTLGELMPFTGQSAGMIHDVLPAAEIVRQLAAETESALARAAAATHAEVG
jgi:enoyl-[acyl-carrier protein] reductase II